MIDELPGDIAETVASALAEDVGTGDATAALIDDRAIGSALVLIRERGVLCGTAWFDEVFRQVDARISVEWLAVDGDTLAAGAVLCRIEGPARGMLTAERTALNFLQTLSGTATLASRYARAVEGTDCRVLDTRKTLPGLRSAQKYAVRCGGCHNHRMGLFDAVLIKENHIMAAGSLGAAVANARRRSPGLTVEVEVESLEQLGEAIAAQADRVMLDNFSVSRLAEAVALAREGGDDAGRIELEASGNVDLDTLPAIAATGVDYVSVGGLTKHVRAVDLSMRFALPV